MRATPYSLSVGGREVRLSRDQCELVLALAEQEGRPLSVHDILASVYGRRLVCAMFGSDDWASLRQLISRTNRACTRAGIGDAIKSVHGAGYRWAASSPWPTGCQELAGGLVISAIAGPENMVTLEGAPTNGVRA